MADVPTITDNGQLQQIAKYQTDIAKKIEEQALLLAKNNDWLKSIESGAQKILKNFSNINGEIVNMNKGLMDGLRSVQGIVTNSIALFGGANDAMKGFTGSFDGVGLVSSKVQELKNNLSFASAALPADVQKQGKAILALAENYANAASRVQSFKQRLVEVYASTGQLNTLIGTNGNEIKDLTEKSISLADKFTKVATATGITTDEVEKFSSKLASVPKALSESVLIGGNSFSKIQAAITLARGSGQSFDTVIESLNKSYDILGSKQDPEKGIKYFSMISEAAQGLSTRFKDVQGFADSLITEFKFMGDVSEGAVRILSEMSPALQRIGLSAQSSTELVKGLVSQVSHLEVGTKALLSARSGGPGGLQGAFQIDKMIRDGKIDQVVEMLQKNLKKQLGGRIVTADEAASSPQAASQYMKQLKMVQSGAFGGLVKDEGQAQKLFEAMAKGNMGLASDALKKPTDALRDTFSRGEALQKDTNTILDDINAKIASLVQNSAFSAEANTKTLIGTGSEKNEDIILKKKRKAESDMLDNMPNEKNGLMNGNLETAITESLGNVVGEFKNFGTIMSGLEASFKDLFKSNENTLENSTKVGPRPSAISSGIGSAKPSQDMPMIQNKETSTKQELVVTVKSYCEKCSKETVEKMIDENNSKIKNANVGGTSASTI